jgi:MFS family permease
LLLGPIINIVFTMGEELGWRGFLLPKLLPIGQWKAILFSGLIWGTVSDAIGRKHALILVYLIHAVAFAIFGLWVTPTGFTVSAILFGLAAWSIPAIMAATCGDVLGSRLAPAAFGFITSFFGLGQAIGPSVAGAIADATGSFALAFIFASIVALLGAGGALMLRPTSTARET